MSNDEVMQNIHESMDEIHQSLDAIRYTIKAMKNELRIFTCVYVVACAVASYSFLNTMS